MIVIFDVHCYEAGISKNGNSWSRRAFTKNMVNRAYAAMKEIEPNPEKRRKLITLYGGEPLLKENVEIVEYIIKKGIQEGYHFDAITNGHDLDCYTHVFDTGALKSVQITLDGDRDLHDSRRYHYKTKKSFDKILDNITLLLQKNIGVNIRFNMDGQNFSHVKKLREIFKDKGFLDDKNFRFYAAMLRAGEGNVTPESTLVGANNQSYEKLILEDHEDYKYLSRTTFNKLSSELATESSNQDYGLYDKLFSAIKHGNYLRLQSVFCGVQSNMFIFDPLGEIYNCWETVGVKNHVLGSYKNGILWNEELQNWQGRNIGNIPKCSVCKYSLLCGGGCLAKALRFGGELGFKASYCDNYGDIVKTTMNRVFKDWKEQLKHPQI